MADQELKIEISTPADLAGAEAAKGAIGEVRQAAATADKEQETATLNLREKKHLLREALRGLGPEYSHLGHMATLFLNPTTAAFGAMIVTLMLLKKVFSEAGGAAETMAKDIADVKDASIKSDAEFLKFLDSLAEMKPVEKVLSDAMDATIGKMDAMAKAEEKVADAFKKEALARLELMKITGQITSEEYVFAKASVEGGVERDKLAREERERQGKILVMQEERGKAEAGLEAAMAALPGAKRRAEDAEKTVEMGRKAVKAAREDAEEMSKPLYSVRFLPGALATLEAEEKTQARREAAASTARARLEEVERDAKALRERAGGLTTKIGAAQTEATIYGAAGEQALGVTERAAQISAQAASIKSAHDEIEKTHKEIDRTTKEIARTVQRTGRVHASLGDHLRALNAHLDELESRIRQLEGAGANNRNNR